MLAGRPEGESEDAGRRSGGRRVVAGLAVALAVLAPAGMVAALTGEGSEEPSAQSSDSSGAPKTFKPHDEAVADPFPTDPKTANRYPGGARAPDRQAAGRTRRQAQGEDRPQDGVRARSASSRSSSGAANGSRVLVPELDNGEIAWIHQDKVSELGTVAWSMHVDLSQRLLVVRKDGKKVRTARIGIGRSDHPTPKGRFAVTDKLKVTQPGSPYGCCVLALTGHQTKLPPGWPGGDRLAVHATARPERPRQAGEPGLHAHRSARHALDAQAHPARHARLHPRLGDPGRRSHNGPPDRVKYIV